jgi:hypothetical protein
MLKMFIRDDDFAHPLADPKELKRVLAGLPAKDYVGSLDELAGWLESVHNASGLTPLQGFEIARQLDEAGQPLLRHLTRVYLSPSQRSRSEEQKLWQLCAGYCVFVADAYQSVIDLFLDVETEKGKSRQADVFRPQLPLVLSRQAAALSTCAKWRRFHHQPPLPGMWSEMGQNFLLAEARKVDGEAVMLYPLTQVTTTPRREYVKAVVLESSSLDSLLPVQVEVAEKLVSFFSPQFVMSRQNRLDNLYWVDAQLDAPPQRLAKVPKNTPGVRLLGLGEVPGALAAITRLVERGELPETLNLGGQYTPRLVLSVLRHLGMYWTAKPPQRKHRRHPVRNRLVVQHGFAACIDRMSGVAEPAEEVSFDFCAAPDTWLVGDVSMGGFGATVLGPRKEWLRVGALLAMRPEAASNWMLGVVRRCLREDEKTSSVGIQTLARQARCLDLVVTGRANRNGLHELALMIEPEGGEEGVRLVLPAATFDLWESYRAEIDGRSAQFSPVELLESVGDYQIGHFRLHYPD